jgi:hypothetical protein
MMPRVALLGQQRHRVAHPIVIEVGAEAETIAWASF